MRDTAAALSARTKAIQDLGQRVSTLHDGAWQVKRSRRRTRCDAVATGSALITVSKSARRKKAVRNAACHICAEASDRGVAERLGGGELTTACTTFWADPKGDGMADAVLDLAANAAGLKLPSDRDGDMDARAIKAWAEALAEGAYKGDDMAPALASAQAKLGQGTITQEEYQDIASKHGALVAEEEHGTRSLGQPSRAGGRTTGRRRPARRRRKTRARRRDRRRKATRRARRRRARTRRRRRPRRRR